MIDNLTDLKKLFKLCRAQGIDELKLGDIQIKFGDLPANQSQDEDIVNPMVKAAHEAYIADPLNDPLAFYSSPQIQTDDLNESMTG